MKISFVYFDIGGVVVQDFFGTNKWKQLQLDLGITEKHTLRFQAVWKQYRNRICINTNVDSLLPVFQKEFGITYPQGYSLLEDFVNRFEQNLSIWPVIEKIHTYYPVGLLTNMYVGMYPLILKKGLLPPVTWNVIVDSSVVGLQKPDGKIYELAKQRANVHHNEILFVENGEDNLKAAQNLGWQTFFYDSRHPAESSQKLLELVYNKK
jgi:FMN phosphatase YigB (HAD superfamily)